MQKGRTTIGNVIHGFRAIAAFTTLAMPALRQIPE
jgi:hypothetical protein